jgi:stage II sporulation protein AA (anti-sigma F factor antagonist)
VQIFRLTESDLEAGCRQIEVEGELDLAVSDQLQEAIARAGEHQQVLISLARCDFIDSTGIAVIVRAYRQMGEEGRRLSVCSPTDQVLRVLSITGLTANGLVFQSPEEVLGGAEAAR